MTDNTIDIAAMIAKAREEYAKTAPSVYSTLDDKTKAMCYIFNIKVD